MMHTHILGKHFLLTLFKFPKAIIFYKVGAKEVYAFGPK